MLSEAWMWDLFAVLVVAMLAIDLGVLHRNAQRITVRRALWESALWIALALLLCAVIAVAMEDGRRLALEYLACYLTEKSLSVDNLFVFAMIFRYFAVPDHLQHRVLFWGILGALVLRGLFIFLGIELIERFTWTAPVLGVVLVLTGARLFFQENAEVDPDKNLVLRVFRRWLPMTGYHGGAFVVREEGKLRATPLLLALLVVESTDVVFAVDSVPAALAISPDLFVVYSSNVMAILGLRALYFALAGLLGKFRFLHFGLAAILVLVGIKMLVREQIHVPAGVTLAAVAGILALSVLASLRKA